MHSSSKLLTSAHSKPGPLTPSPAIWYPAEAGRSRGIDSLESSQQVLLMVQEEQEGHRGTDSNLRTSWGSLWTTGVLAGGLRDLMAGMMGGAQENLAGGETDQQTLFMIQGVMGAMGGGGNSTTMAGLCFWPCINRSWEVCLHVITS